MEISINSFMTTILDKANDSLTNVGIEIRYIGEGKGNPEMFINVLEGGISLKSRLNIIEIGANDGKSNDPIYEFVNKFSDFTNILLIEPQKSVLPYLDENYADHPSSEIVNKAISIDGEDSIQLYRIKKEYWEDFSSKINPPYYREPTGITSSNKQHVMNWASKRLENPEKAVEGVIVEACSPNTLVEDSELLSNIDVLQVDTEGMDDEVVYSFIEDNIYPSIINIESKHLTKEENKTYDNKLPRHGYDIYNYTSGEKLALRRRSNR